MKMKAWITSLALGLLLSVPSGVFAQTACPAGDLQLLGSNNGTTVNLEVCLSVSGNTLAVDTVTNGSGTPLSPVIDNISWNTSASITSFTDPLGHGSWMNLAHFATNTNADGWGVYASQQSGVPINVPNAAGLSWTFGASPGTDIALHLRFANCSGWVSTRANGGSNIAIGENNCTGTPPPVPEPGTLTLLGTGLLGIAGIIRRRLSS